MLSTHKDNPLTLSMLMDFHSPMEVLRSIFGPLQPVSAKIIATVDGTALAPNTQGIPLHHS